MASKRRKEYLPIAKYPVYNSTFDKLRLASRVLNTDTIPSISSILWDQQNIRTELNRLINEDLLSVKLKLKDIELKFLQYQQNRVNQGFEKPNTMPLDLQNEKYNIEAGEDVLLEEIEFLERQLKTYIDAKAKEDDSKVLDKGLVCSFRNHGIQADDPEMINVMKEIDGQNVSVHPKGFLYISDERSPYNGMAIADYRKLAKIWVQDRIKADDELLKLMQKEAKEKGEPLPRITGQSFNSRKVDRRNLPPYPSWAKNYSINEPNEEHHSVKRRRINKESR
jgi:hypothetical protein